MDVCGVCVCARIERARIHNTHVSKLYVRRCCSCSILLVAIARDRGCHVACALIGTNYNT